MKKHLKYAGYLARHKWFVFVAGIRTKAPLWRLIIHDWSKFLPCEWFPYVNYFYGNGGKGREAKGDYDAANTGDSKFDRAWLHHQHANPHHWQHWTLLQDSGEIRLLEMPINFIREMVADWMGAGRAITGKWEAAEWYAKNREIIQLAPQTRIEVENILGAAHAGGGTN